MVKLISLTGAVIALVSVVSAAPASSCSKSYTVKSGDTCAKIGNAQGVSTSNIIKWNSAVNSKCTNLSIGQKLCLSTPKATTTTKKTTTKKTTTKKSTTTKTTPVATPTSDVVYTVTCSTQYVVKSGDTCSNIGKAFDVYTNSIFNWNPAINPSCTNLYIGQILCLSAPTTKTSVLPVSTPTSTKSTSVSTKTATILTMTDTNQCASNDDCPGVYCCNLFTNQCVLDPNGNICDIKPTTSIIKTTVTNSKTITTKITKTNSVPTATATPVTPGVSGKTVQVSSAQDFCLFLPPSPGNMKANNGKVDTDAIANSEKNAVTFCTQPNINAPGAGLFPSGFIKSATFAQDTSAGFVQVRGSLKISAYSLSSKDDGGQYDDHGAGSPPDSMCAGYPYFVSLIEPSTADFCIRCCETYSDCNAGRSAYGCDRVVPAI